MILFSSLTTMSKELKRCGYCGSYFEGLHYLSADELNFMTAQELDEVPLGYCPNAQNECSSYEEVES